MRHNLINPGLALLTALALGACSTAAGASAGTAQPSSATSAVTTVGASSAPAASPAAVGEAPSSGVVDVCRLVTAADVEQLFPGSVTATTEPTNASGCSYVFEPEEQGLTIEVVAGDMASTFWSGNIAPQGSATIALGGIGDQAMRTPGLPDLVAIKGTTFCEVETNGAPELYQGLATPDAHDEVPDAVAAAISQKLGAMCNKVFAGG